MNGTLNRNQVSRVVISLLQAESERLRRCSGVSIRWGEWGEELAIRGGGWGADSLELLTLSAAVNEMFHVYESVLEDLLLRYKLTSEWIDVVMRSLEQYSEKITFQTSGSMGRAKRCEHSMKDLWQEAAEWAAILPNVRRIVAAVPAHHIYGFLWTVLLPEVLGVEVVDARGWDPGMWQSRIEEGDLVVAHPMLWGLLARTVRRWPAVTAGITSTAPLDRTVAAKLRAAGLASLVEVYGSSETAGIGWREDMAGPYRLARDWRRVNRGNGTPVLERNQGRVRVEPLDELCWVSDTEFFVTSRRDEVVQVGGVNVSPQAVAGRILEHPLLSECAVRKMTAQEGERLKAFLVFAHPALDTPENRQKVEGWIHESLSPVECPRSIEFGESLPRNELGKLRDWPAHASGFATAGV